MKKTIHKIKHWLGLNTGYCDAFYKDGKMYMSFVCNDCGKRSGIHLCDKIIDKELPQ